MIQVWDVLRLLSAMQFFRVWWEQEKNLWIILATEGLQREWRMGTRNEPWGTPQGWRRWRIAYFHWKCSVWQIGPEPTQWWTGDTTYCLGQSINTPWSMVSNAALRSHLVRAKNHSLLNMLLIKQDKKVNASFSTITFQIGLWLQH